MVKDIDEHIRRAMEEGEFDNLPGKGKPLRWDENPHEDPEWRLAYHVLRSNDFTLPWIDKRKEIEAAIQAARGRLARAWEWRRSSYSAAKRSPAEIEAEWSRALDAFGDQIQAINKDISSYNLQAPLAQLQMLPLRADPEIGKITAS